MDGGHHKRSSRQQRLADAAVVQGAEEGGRKGHTAACKYIHAQGGEWGYDACGGAAEANNLELLQWLHDNECLWDCAEVCGHAARNGSAEMMLLV
jgi:hypothetical protein